MRTLKTVGIRGSTEGDYPFKMSVLSSGEKQYVKINPRSVIYKSFGWKDMMVHTGYIDQSTKGVIQAKEGSISGHAIVGLDQNLEVKEANSIVFLKVNVYPNLTPESAEIVIAGGKEPWSGFPEPIIFNPPLQYEEDGSIKEESAVRFQKSTVFVIGYLTDDPSQDGLSVNINKKSQKLVQVTKNNILLNTFNYDGWPVLHGIPYFGGFFDYISGAS
jgi:hypothetical protein